MTKIKKIDTRLETALLKNMSDRGIYEQYHHLIDYKRLLPNTELLLSDYGKYYKAYPAASSVEFTSFYTHFAQEWHTTDLEQTDIDYYRDYVFPAIEECPTMDIDKCLLGLIEKQCVEDIDTLCKKSLDVSKLLDIIDMFEAKKSSITRTNDTELNTIDTIDFKVLDKAEGIPWFLPSLQQNLMSITMGQYVLVVGDFGTGKSAFVVNQVEHTIRHLNKKKDTRPVLYFNSEGTAADVMARYLSCLYREKVPGGFEEIVDRIEEIKQKYLAVFDSKQLIVIQMSDVGTFDKLAAKVKKYKPALVIIDICDKLAKEEDVISLKKLHDNLRVLAGAECPIIGTSQSGVTSYTEESPDGGRKQKNKKWLGASDTYGAKTGKGGAADTIITIGKEDEQSPMRFISVPKKKRGEQCRIVCELIDKYSHYKQLDY